MTATNVPPVTFVYADFIAAYPQFANCSAPQLAVFFAMSDAFFSNTTRNPAFCDGVTRMTSLAYILTAHIAWLFAPRDSSGNPAATGQMPPMTVGQITSASEGSVSVGLAEVAKGGATALAGWFAQTPFGFMFWQATAQYRTMRYLAHPTIVPSALYPLYPMGIGRRRGF
jgi:hypothetical protein